MKSTEKTFREMSKKELVHELEGCSGRNGWGYSDPRVASSTMQIIISELDRRSNRLTQVFSSIISAIIGGVVGSIITFLQTH